MVTLADLPVCFHTTHYERFFLVNVDLKVNGEKLKLRGASGSSLYLEGPLQLSISSESLLSAANVAGKEHGISHVARLCCGRQPLLEVDFFGKKDITTFLKSLRERNFQQLLETLLREKMVPETISVSVDVNLFLIVPLGESDARFVEVTLENFNNCLKTLKAGNNFDFGNIIPLEQFLDYNEDLSFLLEETMDVVYWYTLGVLLKVKPSELEQINVDCRLSQEGLTRMLGVWLKTGRATWSTLVHALNKMGLNSLGMKIAMEKGVPVDDVQTDTCESYETEVPEALSRLQKELEQKGQQKTKSSKLMQQAEDRKQLLADELLEICQSLRQVTRKSAQLAKEKELLELEMAEKKRKQEKFLSLKASMSDKEVISETIEIIHESIYDLKQHIRLLELEITQKLTKEEQLKKEIANKEKEADYNKHSLQELEEKHMHLSSELDTQRKLFDFQLRLTQESKESNEAMQEELKAQIAYLKEELSKKDMLGPPLQVNIMRDAVFHGPVGGFAAPGGTIGSASVTNNHTTPITQTCSTTNEAGAGQPPPSSLSATTGGILEKATCDYENSQPACIAATHGLVGVSASSLTSKIDVTVPASFCVGREGKVRVTAKGEDILYAKLRKNGQTKSQAVTITHNKEDGSILLSVKPQEEGVHFLSITVLGQNIPKSPFYLPVNNREYYYTSFKQPVQTIDLASPGYIAFSASGNIFVTSTLTHSVHVYNSDGEKQREIGKKGNGILEFSYPCGIAISGDEVYVADYDNCRVQKFSTQGRFRLEFGSYGSGKGQLRSPLGVTIARDGMVYVSDSDNNQVVVFHSVGTFSHSIDISASVDSPAGLAISADGKLHIAGSGSKNYAVFTLTGKLLRKHKFFSCGDVAIDAAGYVFVAGYVSRSDSLSIFGPRGHLIHTVRLDHPRSVAIDPVGFVWVAEHGTNRLRKY